MEHGYYWLHLEGQEPEVVEIDGDSMYRCGSDMTCHLEDGKWIEFGETLEVVALTGAIAPPNNDLLDISKEMLTWIEDDIKDGDHSGPDNPEDLDIVVRAREIIKQHAETLPELPTCTNSQTAE